MSKADKILVPVQEGKTFKSTLEATEFMDKFQKLLKDPRMAAWAKETDRDLGKDWAATSKELDEILEDIYGFDG